MKKRVVITGMGALTPVGHSVTEFWENLKQGKSGVAKVTRFEINGFPTEIAAEVKNFEPAKYIEKKETRKMDLVEQYAIAAAQQAVDDAGISSQKMDPHRIGVVIGSGIGGIDTLEKQHKNLITGGHNRVSPFFIPMMIIDMCAGLVAMRFGFKGPNYATVSACASSAHALADSFKIIQRGEADIMLSGGSEATITPLSMAGFCSARAMSTRNDQPEKASRPFDKGRDGFVMGEGSGMLVLESLDSALARGAKIYAEVMGAGMTADAYHITAPSPTGEGACNAMKIALKDADLQPQEVDYINAHGTSTGLGDISETLAIKNVFGEHAHKLAVNSTKSVIGHLLGAAGAVEAIVCVKTIQDGILHPTINQEVPDPQCDLDYVPNSQRKKEIKVALSNSFGFGGHNVTLAVKKYQA
ncbi:MAG TPA: beta-ketoacyl-ACP synthase II [candidate division Zixibacteria bacterium]|nr:beta-ketoacyl-ACP synthase II [candidate division Zixibacteria bacterium]